MGTTLAKVVTIIVTVLVVATGTTATLAAVGVQVPLPLPLIGRANDAQPVLQVQSAYRVGSLPAGSTSTMFQLSGQHFAAHATITILLDGRTMTGTPPAYSDAQGTFKAALTITAGWAVGVHTLSARDAQGNTTQTGGRVQIVSQGEANTPGPHGAPPDDASFQITTQFGEVLIVTGRPDPAGGTVCQARDDGQAHTSTNPPERVAERCTGSYKGGQLTYHEIVLSLQVDTSPDGNDPCTLVNPPRPHFDVTGAFISPTTITGSWQEDQNFLNCRIEGTIPLLAETYTQPWTGTVSSGP